ncbi:hypothetical protein H696_02535 [Fonticula alba]|uniref:Uncharacterized protein n=1 Tax=Fonticula alba TaxID=691883 RepID=A0A058ZDQ1_FONAL|nr:hypothetical protein H696_02535 [Fonticula alba]KCV71592.1 hypothetical protein H696_02535 [Fonticula alba]|eukprot:XP_009494715.1 hypothetical protein H696_02535 [Fonticula alba]
MFHGDSYLEFVWLSCRPAGPGESCVVTGPSTRGSVSGRVLPLARRLDARHLYVTDEYLMTQFIRANPEDRSLNYVWIPASDLLPLPGGWILQVTDKVRVSAGPMGLLFHDEPRWMPDGIHGAMVPEGSSGVKYRGILLPRGAEAGPGQEADPPAGELFLVEDMWSAAWDVIHVAGGVPPTGHARSRAAGTRQHRLGMLPQAPRLGPEEPPRSRVFGVRLAGGSPEYPSALVLLSKKYIGMSVLWCRPGGRAACVLLPATFADLPEELQLDEQAPLWVEPVVHTPARGTVHGAGLLATLLTYSPGAGLVYVTLRVPCPPGTAGLYCLPCHSECVECWAPGDSAACTQCPPGKLLALGGGLCGDTCAGDAMPGQGPAQGTCVACLPGTAGSGCGPCDPTCLECSAPGDPYACTSCPPGRLMSASTGACLLDCSRGTMPGIGLAAGTCVSCPATCRAAR